MKKSISIVIAMCIALPSLFAQSPEKFNYQAIARDAGGNELVSQTVGVQFQLHQSTAGGAVVYAETHNPTTNAIGLFSVAVGNGSPTVGSFNAIDWSAGPYFLEVGIDPAGGTGYTSMGTQQLLSVPYALYAKTTENYTETDPVYGVSVASSISAFDTAYWNGKLSTEVDGSVTNEIQDISLLGNEMSITEGSTVDLSTIDNGSWSTTGNTGIDPASNFIGTTDDQALIFKVNNLQAGKISTGNNTFYGLEAGVSTSGQYNTAIGYHAFNSIASGYSNTAVGAFALQSNTTGYKNIAVGGSALSDNTSGHSNIAVGGSALSDNTTGHQNTAMGYVALENNTTGIWNIAIGSNALRDNITGNSNIAVGVLALARNTSGSDNTAVGINALRENTTGIENTAVGRAALIGNTIGVANTANGYRALSSNTTGNHNTAIGNSACDNTHDGQRNTALGSSALHDNYSGNDNTAIGFTALKNSTGDDNTAIGRTALFSNWVGDENTAIGRSALYYNTSGHKNTAVGRSALVDVTSGSNNSGIGYDAQVPTATASNQVRIGNTDVTYAGIQVSWSITSDEIWKEQIRELPYGLDMVMQLKPVDYNRKNNEIKTREMGFVAQDVEATLKEMGYDEQGFLTKDDDGHLSLRYNDFIALLTKAIQEQQEIIEQQSTEIEAQNINYEKLLKRIEQLEKSNNQ